MLGDEIHGTRVKFHSAVCNTVLEKPKFEALTEQVKTPIGMGLRDIRCPSNCISDIWAYSNYVQLSVVFEEMLHPWLIWHMLERKQTNKQTNKKSSVNKI